MHKTQSIDRRRFAGSLVSAAALSTLSSSASLAVGEKPKLTAAVFGHTGRGNYGHGMEKVWAAIPRAKLIAVADADESGLKKMAARLKVKGYADYRKLLESAKPDLVSIGPRWLDQHHDMVTACAEAGVRGIYLEKPMCRDLREADQMVAACEKHGTKLAIATQNRYSPRTHIISKMIRNGELGEIVEIRARGKDDRRGGGEDLWVLGTHMLDLMNLFGQGAQNCFARVLQQGKPITAADIKDGPEGIGPLAGDEVHAMYQLGCGAIGYWDSRKNANGNPSRFGIRVQGTKGVVELYDTGLLPFSCYLPASSWSTGRSAQQWLPITSAGIDKPEPLPAGGLHEGNVAAVNDLIDCLDSDSRLPLANIYEARKTVEMIAAIFESQRLQKSVDLPLKNRQNPLELYS